MPRRSNLLLKVVPFLIFAGIFDRSGYIEDARSMSGRDYKG